MVFFFNCEKCGHIEIECHEGNETKKLIEKEDNYCWSYFTHTKDLFFLRFFLVY
jgi:hypothetical protein